MAGLKLNLCCGLRPIVDYLNVDIVDLPPRFPNEFKGIDFLRYDLNERPWPWDDGSISWIVMRDGFEHLKVGTFLEITNEMWRVLVPGGKAAIRVPDARWPDAFTDPTHQIFFTSFSFAYLDPTTLLGQHMRHYTPYKFHVTLIEKPEEHALHFVIRKSDYVP